MFDDNLKPVLFAIGAVAVLMGLATDRYGPRTDLATAVDTGALPPVPATAGPGGAPAQTPVAALRVALGGGFEARLLYAYTLEGRVVTRRQFRNDPTSAVSPLDLGIVWGDLARPGGTDALSFRTRPRAVSYRAEPGAILPRGWETQVTNNHLIPADPSVHAALNGVAVGDHVRLQGYLVVVTGDQITPWRSSTRRDDNTIIGGCEIILVTGVEVLPGAGA